MTDRTRLAARNNARWVAAVCATHGLDGVLDDVAWTCPGRTPPLHPDAVTLSPEVDVPALLARVDASEGCSVKDSWSRLDLGDHGFEPLLRGRWVWLDPAVAVAPATRRWERVRTADELTAWASGWAQDPGDAAILRPGLLARAGVQVLRGVEDGQVVTGATVCVSHGVAGVGNVFDASGDTERAWRDVAAAIRGLAPSLPVVGWETDDALPSALGAGCERLGELTVWLR